MGRRGLEGEADGEHSMVGSREELWNPHRRWVGAYICGCVTVKVSGTVTMRICLRDYARVCGSVCD